MADEKITIDIEAKIDAAQSIKDLKELKLLQRQVAAGSPEFAKLANAIDDLEDSIKGAKKGSADWIDTLESAGGPIGALGAGLNKAKVATVSFGAALKATGIGLIVSLIGGLVAALSKSEDTMKKFEPIIIMFEQALNGILGALQPLIDGFIELAMNVMPIVTNVFKTAYSAVTALFQSFGKLGGAIVKLFKGDFKGAWEDAKASVTGFSDNYDAAVQRFEVGTKKITKTQKENLKQQNDDAKKAFDEKLKRMEAEDKLDEAKLKKLKEEALALATTEQEKLDVEKKFAELSYNARIKDLDDKMTLYKKDSVEYKNLQTEKTNAEAEFINQKAGFVDKQKKIDEDNIKARKDFEQKIKEILTAAIDDETQKLTQQRQDKLAKDLADLEEDKQFILLSETKKEEVRKALREAAENDITNIEIKAEQDRLSKKLRLLELNGQALLQGTQAYYDNRRALINALEQQELNDLKSQYEQKKISKEEFEKATTDIQSKYAQQRKNTNTEELNAYLGYASNILGAINNIFSAASEVNKMQQEQDLKNAKGNAVEEEKIRKRAFEQNKKTQIAQAIIGTLQAAIQAYQSLAIIPVVGPALGAAAAAAALIFGYKKVALIKAQTYESQASGAAGGQSATATGTSIQAPTIPTAATPQIQTTGGMNPSTQIAQSISNAQSPIKAYVVSGEISSQQALDRRTNRAATFVGG
jgi:hypothetical protein